MLFLESWALRWADGLCLLAQQQPSKPMEIQTKITGETLELLVAGRVDGEGLFRLFVALVMGRSGWGGWNPSLKLWLQFLRREPVLPV